MGSTEKINIYVSEETYQNILHDCEYFHIEKNKKGEFIKNRFFTRLVVGYHQAFIDKSELHYKEIKEAIESSLFNKNIDEKEIQEIAQVFSEKMTKTKEKKRKGIKYKTLSYKPVKETSRMLNDEIEDKMTFGSYFNSLLIDYFSEPMAKRETILYKPIYDELRSYCNKQTPITIYTKNDKAHKIIPYKIVQGHNGMFNYLLCGESADTLLNNEPNTENITEARCYHLYYIDQIEFDKSRRCDKLSKQVLHQLDMMIKKGPEHAINSSESASIKMTEEGHNLFKRVYSDRPIPDGPAKKKENHYIYTFTDCSLDQLYFYFRRFGPEAEILEPESLRKRLIEFHEQSLAVYK